MARLSSVERWSATMIWSANLLVTARNRSRIHASLRTGVTTTTRTGSRGGMVLRYDGASETEEARAVCDAGTGFAYWCDEPRRLPGGVRRRVAPGQWHARLPQRAGGAVSDARRRRRARGRRDRRDRELQGPIHRRARVCRTALRIGERGRDRPAHLARDWRRPIRLLWIDGDHQYEAVKRDLALFRPYLAPGAIVAMHDVLGTWPGPLRAFVEDVLGSDDFGPAGCFKSIGWAQYRPADGGRGRRFRWRRWRLAGGVRDLIPRAAGGSVSAA